MRDRALSPSGFVPLWLDRAQLENSLCISQFVVPCGKHNSESEKIPIDMEKLQDHSYTLLVSSRSDRVHGPCIMVYIILCTEHNNMACALYIICIAYYTFLCM